ncbi:MAG TPA: NFACT RNA binding domain-containing protein [Thermomicrobiales bacterium]|nr:NFACT RNA binding domain-containing protein [Thermomicrobiales bacterium]
MYDALTIAAVVDELNETILDGRVQRVLQLDRLTVGLEIYAGRRWQVLLSADSRAARLHLVREGRLTGDAALVTPLLLLLRKYARGARLVRVAQEPPLERTVFLRFARFFAGEEEDEDAAPEGDDAEEWAEEEPAGELVETTLAVEIMGRHSNLILVGPDGRIMDSAKRVPPHLSRVRPILPRGRYGPVPPQAKADPRTIAAGELAALLAADPAAPLATALVGGLRGLSPQVAREAAYRAAGSAREKAQEAQGREEALRRALDELYAPLRTGAWEPRLYRNADGAAVAFSPFPLYHLRELEEEREPSISTIAERFFATTQAVQAHAQRKEALAARIRAERERLEAREHSLRAELARAEEAERWRRWGEAIYAYAWSLAPGQRELVADDLVVPLDPARTPSENAQGYFERYRKAQSAAANLPELLAAAEVDRRYLDQLLTMLDLAGRYDEIAALQREWRDWQAARRGDAPAAPPSGKRKDKAGRGKPAGGARPRPLRARGGHQIYVGHTGAQNDAVTFDLAAPGDTWLHARGVPGAHVVVKWARDAIEEAVLEAAAQLAAYYSAGRGAGHAEVDYAARRDVRKIKGAGPGMVTYRNERTLRVAPRSEEELRRTGLIE